MASRTTPSTTVEKKPGRAPSDRQKSADALRAEAVAERPEGADLLRPVEDLRSSEQADITASLVDLFKSIGIDVTASEEERKEAADIEVNGDTLRATGKIASILEENLVQDEDGATLAAFVALDKGHGAQGRMLDLAMFYLAELGE